MSRAPIRNTEILARRASRHQLARELKTLVSGEDWLPPAVYLLRSVTGT